jgi:hypothetical protein
MADATRERWWDLASRHAGVRSTRCRGVARPAARARLEAHQPGRSFGRCEGIGKFKKVVNPFFKLTGGIGG